MLRNVFFAFLLIIFCLLSCFLILVIIGEFYFNGVLAGFLAIFDFPGPGFFLVICIVIIGALLYIIIDNHKYRKSAAFQKQKTFRKACRTLNVTKCYVTATDVRLDKYMHNFTFSTKCERQIEVVFFTYLAKKYLRHNAAGINIGDKGIIHFREFNETKFFERFEKFEPDDNS